MGVGHTLVAVGVIWGLVLLLESGVQGQEWVNGLGEMLSRSCMYGFGISGFYSKYNAQLKDRQWMLNCSRISMDRNAQQDCIWTSNFVNEPGDDFNFTCPEDNYYIAGLYSDFDKELADRSWRIECCRSSDVELTVCLDTDFINVWQGTLWFKAPPEKTFVGIQSDYDYRRRRREACGGTIYYQSSTWS